ncbi:GGDEF domain-containing protein [Psychromonas sp. Urea-02u-13]|uniref:GGDEF domain-containing protein n=1 Tax=Psychromonas sp. Urea-02u-13 TaxID=2058326 RepID=UPI0012FE9BCD|nr:GGDEF domain-containing protein [Psychromonas sp. Urea-02u-13]
MLKKKVMMMRYKKAYFLFLIVLLFTISAGASLSLLNKSHDLLLWNERASGRALVQLVILQQSYLSIMMQYQRGDEVADELLTYYDLTWSAYDVLLKGSKNAYFMSDGWRASKLNNYFTRFKMTDPTKVKLSGELLTVALHNTREAHNYIVELLNFEFQGYSQETHQHDFELVRVNKIMIMGLFGLTFSGTIFLLIIIRERRQMTYLAYHDPLTRLANRSALKEKITALQKKKTSFCALLIDIDRFKAINDSYGHDIGDKLLIRLTEKMTLVCSESDFIARLGGDEFTIICQSKSVVEAMALSLLSITDNVIDIDGKSCDVGMSIGISFSRTKHFAWVDILKEADDAMYQAKEKGGGKYQTYDPAVVTKKIL